MFRWCLALVLLLAAFPCAAKAPTHYSGNLNVAVPGTLEPPGGYEVIRTQKAYEAFVARIPTHVITPQNPAPASDDPLLAKPRFDFGKVCLVAAWTSNLSHEVKVAGVRETSDGRVIDVTVTIPAHADMVSRPLGVGRYDLLVVPTFRGVAREKRTVVDQRKP